MKRQEIRDLLEEAFLRNNRKNFIANDPICIPHRFTKKEDVEIAGFLAATLAWGKRENIIRSADRLLRAMDESPHQFVIHHSSSDLKALKGFVHRTFNAEDGVFFIRARKHLYLQHGGLEKAFALDGSGEGLAQRIGNFRKKFLEPRHLKRSE